MRPPPPLDDQFFSDARAHFDATVAWLRESTATATHNVLEDGVAERGFEVMRLLLQGAMKQRSSNEWSARAPLSNGQRRRRSARTIESRFGTLVLARDGMRDSATSPTRFALDAALGLPPEKYSHPLRKAVARAASQGAFERAIEAAESTGAHVPKRQAEALALRAARDVDAFYAQQRATNATLPSADTLLVGTCDGKGVRMRPEGLREATHKAHQAERKARPKGDPMAKKKARTHDRRMASLAAVYDVAPHVRSVHDIVGGLRPANRHAKEPKPAAPKPFNKRLFVDLEKPLTHTITALFDEFDRRDPTRERTSVVLSDGDADQLAELEWRANARGRRVVIVLDLLHVISYLWKAGFALSGRDEAKTETWMQSHLRLILTCRANDIAGGLRQSATKRGLSDEERAPVDQCANYLLNNQRFLNYADALSRGFPIATGVIEGACRYLVQDRMNITGARWGLNGAEAILRLRAVEASNDFDGYWQFHIEQEAERHHGCKAA